jgi:hypothetical protein
MVVLDPRSGDVVLAKQAATPGSQRMGDLSPEPEQFGSMTPPNPLGVLTSDGSPLHLTLEYPPPLPPPAPLGTSQC